MTSKTDYEIAQAKLDRADELQQEVNELLEEIDHRIERIEELHAEAEELVE
jgi:hypothetical protein